MNIFLASFVFHFEVIDDKTIDIKITIVNEVFELFIGEFPVSPIRYGRFEFGHAVEITQEVGTVDVGSVDTLVTQFGYKSAIAAICSSVYLPEVLEPVVGGDAVDMVNSHAGFDRLDPCNIDGMRDINVFVSTKRMIEHEILLFSSMSIRFYHARIHQSLPSVGIYAYAYGAAVSVIDIERDAGVRVSAHVLYADIVEKK